MKVKLILNVFTLLTMMGLAGCATKGWTEEQLKSAKTKAQNDFRIQNEKLVKQLDSLNRENKGLYTLLRSLSKENSSLHKNLSTLNDKLTKLENLIAATENKTLKDVKNFSKENDRKLYKYITVEQQKHIDELKKEMEKVSMADKNTNKLKTIIQKILDTYDAASKDKNK
jgi:septal ring factor EnvC (AmiA/AmiB activator)